MHNDTTFMFFMAAIGFLCLHYYNTREESPMKQSEYFARYDKKIHDEKELLFKEYWRVFEFLINHFAFYHNDVYFIRASAGGMVDEHNFRVIKKLRDLGWNATIHSVNVLEATPSNIYGYNDPGEFSCQILRTDDIDDNRLNYRDVHGMQCSSPYTKCCASTIIII